MVDLMESSTGHIETTGGVSLDAGSFRRVLSHLPTGVAVITAYTPDGPSGMAANSLTSVSLEPPLILFCAARSSTTWPLVRESGSFCVNIMSRDHEALTRKFSQKNVDRFSGVKWAEREAGPALDGAVAWIECQIDHESEAGDHTIVVGRVTAIEASSTAKPLVFFRGSYGSFSEF